jgi:hypothetical protein
MAAKWFCITGNQVINISEKETIEKEIRIFVESPTKQKAPVQASMTKTLYLLSLGDSNKVTFEFPKRLPIEMMDKDWNPDQLGEPPENSIYVVSPHDGKPLTVSGQLPQADQPSYYVLLKGRTGSCSWLLTDDPEQYGTKGDLITHKRRKHLIVDIIPLEWGTDNGRCHTVNQLA